MIPLIFTRYFRPRPGRAASDAARIYYHIYGDDVAGTTVDNISQMIPTFEEVESFKDTYLGEQIRDETIMHLFGIGMPLPIKLGWEVYSFHDYFNE